MKLNRGANGFFPVESGDCLISSFYEYRKMSAICSHWNVTTCWQTSSILMVSSSELSECSFTKYCYSWPKMLTTFKNIQLLILKTKEFFIILVNLFFSSREEWLNVYKEWKNQMIWFLLNCWKSESCDILITPCNYNHQSVVSFVQCKAQVTYDLKYIWKRRNYDFLKIKDKFPGYHMELLSQKWSYPPCTECGTQHSGKLHIKIFVLFSKVTL